MPDLFYVWLAWMVVISLAMIVILLLVFKKKKKLKHLWHGVNRDGISFLTNSRQREEEIPQNSSYLPNEYARPGENSLSGLHRKYADYYYDYYEHKEKNEALYYTFLKKKLDEMRSHDPAVSPYGEADLYSDVYEDVYDDLYDEFSGEDHEEDDDYGENCSDDYGDDYSDDYNDDGLSHDNNTEDSSSSHRDDDYDDYRHDDDDD